MTGGGRRVESAMEEGREENRKGEVELMLEKNCSEPVSTFMNFGFQ